MSVSPSGAPTIPIRAVGRLTGRADLHSHTHYSDGSDSPAALVTEGRRRGLDVLAVTDHDTLDGALQAVEVARRTDTGAGPEIVVGEEVTSRDGHILGLFLTRAVAPGRSAAETVADIHAQGGIAIAAHPFWHAESHPGRRRHGVGALIGEVPFDAVEVRNGGVTLTMVQANHRAVAEAAAHNLIGVGGSDAHVREALGLALTAFRGRTAADLRHSLVQGSVVPLGRVPSPRTLWGYLSWLWARPTGVTVSTPAA
jgi:predicted metal-dependent phosphoesterase TrpH